VASPRRSATVLEKDLWFIPSEFEQRLGRVQAEIKSRGLAGAVLFQPETVTWVTGFFTGGHGYLQLAIVPADGPPALVCRDVSRYYAERTSAFDRTFYWSDGQDILGVAVDAIRATVGVNERLGIDLDAWPLSAGVYADLRKRLPRATFADVGPEVARLRLIKSQAEIGYQRRAARAAEEGMAAGLAAAKVGATERDVAAAVSSAMILAGSDTPGPGVLSSGERAFHLHGRATDRVLERRDTLQLETCPHVRQYHARFMRTIKVGSASTEDRDFLGALIDIQDRALATVRPGVPAIVPDRIYREGILATGRVARYTNKTFYSIGLLIDPHGAEPLEATPTATWVFEPGQVFHTYVLVAGFGFSETILITESSWERLTTFRRELLISGE
jgi:Xaa-Pro dipeptidase